ncbi:MAG: potassium transporter TrkA, partial [Spirochaetaceae bacterium]|nr:potassium transporter TrkA [Spirochaetaceae bacterium]
YAAITRNIGIDVVVPIKDTVVDTIMSHLRGKSVTGIHTLSEGSFEVVEYELPKNSKADGKVLKDLRSGDETFLILLVNKGESYAIADGNTILSGGDKLVFIADVKDTKHVLDKFGE